MNIKNKLKKERRARRQEKKINQINNKNNQINTNKKTNQFNNNLITINNNWSFLKNVISPLGNIQNKNLKEQSSLLPQLKEKLFNKIDYKLSGCNRDNSNYAVVAFFKDNEDILSQDIECINGYFIYFVYDDAINTAAEMDRIFDKYENIVNRHLFGKMNIRNEYLKSLCILKKYSKVISICKKYNLLSEKYLSLAIFEYYICSLYKLEYYSDIISTFEEHTNECLVGTEDWDLNIWGRSNELIICYLRSLKKTKQYIKFRLKQEIYQPIIQTNIKDQYFI